MSYHDEQVNTFKEAERLKCYMELLAQSNEGIWVGSSGLSMLPLFYHGVEVHINPKTNDIDIGDVIVFNRDNKFIAHRVLSPITREGQLLTKGDTLFYLDAPVHQEEILGIVDYTRKKGKVILVERDRRMSKLSGTLGHMLVDRFSFLPDWAKFLLYFSLFLPAFGLQCGLNTIRKKIGKKRK